MKEFDKMMGYPMETIKVLAEKAKEINRMIELNQRDLHKQGIERD